MKSMKSMKNICIFFLFFLSLYLFSQTDSLKVKDSLQVEKQIKEVTVVGQKKLIERKVDRLVFNVENSISATGGDALDALKVTPGLRVQNDQISMIGKSGMSVMIDDRILQLSGDDLINYLKSIPSDNIKSIEVITTPPAKYDAEGNSGIVNIVLKKAKSDSWKTTFRSMFQQATYSSLSHGMGFSYKKNKFSALADVSYQYGKQLYTNDINYWYPEEHWKNYIFSQRNRKNLGTLLNLQYALSNMSSIGAQFQGTFANNHDDETTSNKSYAMELWKDYETQGVIKTKPENISLNLNYNQKLDTLGKKFSVDMDYFHALSPRENDFTSVMKDFILNTIQNQLAENTAKQDITNYSIKTDFIMPFDWAEISFGAKASFTETSNRVNSKFYDAETTNLISSQSDNFEYSENVQAVYFDIRRKLGKKWDAKVGLRGENMQTKANSIFTNQITNREYFKLFPTAYISYNADENNTFSANFGRRIQRPNFSDLNPAKWYQNPNAYAEGNPFLQPSFVYLYKIDYSYKSLLNFSVSYANVKDVFGQLVYHDIEHETQVFKRLNYADGKQISTSLTINYNPFSWWESSTDFMTGYSEQKSFVDILAKNYSGWQGYTSTQNTFRLNKDKTFFASLYYEYNFPSKSGIYKASSYSTLDIGFKYLMLNKKLTLALNFEDIFKDYKSTIESDFSGIPQSFEQYRDTRFVRISLSYNFGNEKINVRQRKIGNEEEQSRIN
jgi:hypothetical protein